MRRTALVVPSSVSSRPLPVRAKLPAACCVAALAVVVAMSSSSSEMSTIGAAISSSPNEGGGGSGCCCGSAVAVDATTPAPRSSKRIRLECCEASFPSSSATAVTVTQTSPESSLSPTSEESAGPLFGLTLSQEAMKRSDYLSWDEYFMATALLSSRRSKDPYSPSGACLVDPENRIVGIGYNGFPSGFDDERLSKRHDDVTAAVNGGGSDDPDTKWLESREPFLIPAEVNCLLNSAKTAARNTTLYCTEFPGHDCAKFIVQSRRVTKVVYGRAPDKATDSTRVSQLLIQQAGIEMDQFQLSRSIDLAFGSKRLEPTADEEVADTVHPYLSWDEYFMAMALLTSRRSKDPNTQVGACIVSRRRVILACGYNGFTLGCSDDAFPWQRSAPDPKHTKYMYVCHAEVNAILNCQASHTEMDGSTLYVTLFPCYQCGQSIVQAGIRRVVYLNDPYHDDVKFRASRLLFAKANVECTEFRPIRASVTLTTQTT